MPERVRDNALYRNSICKGNYLGSSVTADQYDEIDVGNFRNMYIGDYWTINGISWRIAAFNYWVNAGDSGHICSTRHVVIVPDSSLVDNAQMNSTETTAGAYVGSDFYTGNNGNTAFATAKSIVNNAFGSEHILNHREYLKNAVTDKYESAGAWYDSTVELMTEEMVYGSKEFKNAASSATVFNHTIDKTQLPLFFYVPYRICNRNYYWLRDVVSDNRFAMVASEGLASRTKANEAIRVRPVFAICKANPSS